MSSTTTSSSSSIKAPIFGSAQTALASTLQNAVNTSTSGKISPTKAENAALVQNPQPSVGLTAEQIAQQNAVIQRLEGDLYDLFSQKASKAKLEEQVLKIENHLKLYPGTTSTYIDIFKDAIAKMQGGARKSRKTKKSKTKKNKRKGKAKKSHRRRHHSKSK